MHTTQRLAGVDDLEALMPLVRAFYEADRHPYDEPMVRRALQPLLVDDSVGQVWVVEADHALIGYVVITWSYSLESGGRDCILDEIYVAESSVGIGSGLLTAALEGARSRGARAVFLETEAHNERGRRFYGRHGFEIEDSTWMSRPLHPEVDAG